MAKTLTEADKDRIAAAVAEAEARTSGELLCVLAEEVSAYREVSLAWAAMAALLLPPLLLLLGVQPLAIADALDGWTAAQAASTPGLLGLAISLYAAFQALLFGVVLMLCTVPSVRRLLTPRGLTERRVHQAAFQHLLGASAHLPAGRPAVLIFVSVQDRRLEIVATEAIHAEVGQGAWDQVIRDALGEMRRSGPGDGLIRAVHLCGMLLAQHFPDDGAANAFPNHPVEV